MSNQGHEFFNDEAFHMVPTKLALTIGVSEALFLGRLHYWLDPKRNRNQKGDHFWVYNTLEQWHQQMPFFSVSSIKRIIEKLKKYNLIIISNWPCNQFTRMLSYTINYEQLTKLHAEMHANPHISPSAQIDPLEEVNLTFPKRSKWSDPLGQIEPMDQLNLSRSYTEAKTTTKITTKRELSLNLSKRSKWTKAQTYPEVIDECIESKIQIMLETFNETVRKGNPIELTVSRAEKLSHFLSEKLKGDIEKWRLICQSITRSKFLMGEIEARKFQATLEWILKGDNAQKVLEGDYGKDGEPAQELKQIDQKAITEEISGLNEPELMKDLRAWLIERFGFAEYESWFTKVAFVQFDPPSLTLRVSSAFQKARLDSHYISYLKDYLKDKYQKPHQVELVLEEQNPMRESQSRNEAVISIASPANKAVSTEKKERDTSPPPSKQMNRLISCNPKTNEGILI